MSPDHVYQIVPREHASLVRGPGERLEILLAPIPEFKDRGMYGTNGDQVPDRYLGLHPDAAASLRRIEADYPGVMYHSDIFRNATGSKRRREKNKARKGRYTGKLPGSSAHGYGLATDHLVSDNLRRLTRFMRAGVVDKGEYDELWNSYGWYCHRQGPAGDHLRGPEDWHFNYIGDDVERWLGHCHGRSTAPGIEAKIQYMYGPFTLDPAGIVEHLARLGYRNAHVEAEAAVRKFQEAWTLPVDGIAGPQTQRALLFVGARLVNRNGEDIELTFP